MNRRISSPGEPGGLLLAAMLAQQVPRPRGRLASNWHQWRAYAPDRAAMRRAAVKDPRAVGTLWPTGPKVAAALAELGRQEIHAASRIVEVGAGTGVITEAILARCGPGTRLDVFEKDPHLRAILRRRTAWSDRVIRHSDALYMSRALGEEQADVVVSAFPWTSVHPGDRDAMMAVILGSLRLGGVVLAIQYSTYTERFFTEHFRVVECVRYGRRRWPVLYRLSQPRCHVGKGVMTQASTS